MKRMRLLIDENVQDSIAAYFQERGHEVLLVRDVLARGTEDPVLAAVGDRLQLIIVTCDKDLKRLVSRAARGERQRFRRLGRILLRCNQTRALGRVQATIKSIEFEFDESQSRPDKRLIVEITDTTFVVVR